MPVQAIDPTDPTYGMLADGTPNAQASFIAVLNAAASSGMPIEIPQGDILVIVPSANFNPEYCQLGPCAGEIIIRGVSRYESTLRMGPDSPAFGYLSEFLRGNPAGVRLRISDLHLAGPQSWDTSTNPNAPGNDAPGFIRATAACLTLHGCTSPTIVELERVRFDGYWTSIVSFDNTPGNVTFSATDCDFSAYGACIGMGGSLGDVRQVIMTRCRINKAGIPPDQNFGTAWNHGFYVAPGTTLRLTSVDFDNIARNAIQAYSSHGEGGAQPVVSFLTNCTATNRVQGSFLLANGSIVSGGQFYNLQGFILQEGSRIQGANLGCPVDNGFGGGAPVVLDGCTLLNMFCMNNVGGYATLTGCTAQRGTVLPNPDPTQPQPEPMNVAIAPVGGVTLVENCTFFGGDARLPALSRMPASPAIEPMGGEVNVTGGASIGDYGLFGSGRGSMSLPDGSTAKLTVKRHRFDLPPLAGRPVNDPQLACCVAATVAPYSLTGEDNEFIGCLPWSLVSPQGLKPRVAIAPTPIPAAAVINLDAFNFDEFTIAGPGDVSQLTVGYSVMSPGEQIYSQRCLLGRVQLRAAADGGGFTLQPGGASPGALAIDAPVVVPAGSTVALWHNPEGACTWSLAPTAV
jgi:hypothetical protein